jgi:hypothetical protein
MGTFGYSVIGGIVDKNKKQQAKLSLNGGTPAKEEAPEVAAETVAPEKNEIDLSEKQTEKPPAESESAEKLQQAASSVSTGTVTSEGSTEETPSSDTPPETIEEAPGNQQEAGNVNKEESEQQVEVSGETRIAANPLESQEDKKAEPKTPIESAVMEKDPLSIEKPVIIQQVMENPPETVLPGQGLSESDGKPLHLKIKVQGNSWFNVTVDDDEEEDFILPGGSSKNVYGREKIQLTIGNRNGTELFLNEQPIDLPPGSSDVIRDFDITANLLE